MRIICDELSQSIHGISVSFRLTDVKGDLLFKILPSVCHRIIHVYRIPHNVCQKAHCIIMKSLCSPDRHVPCLRVITPLPARYHFACRPVDHFPPSCNVVTVIHFKHIRVQIIHKVDRQFLADSSVKGRHDIHLLDLVRVCLCPGIVFSRRIICGVNLCIHIFQVFRIVRTVTVADRVCSPSYQQLQCLRNHICICGDGHSSCCVLFHCSSPFSDLSDTLIIIGKKAPRLSTHCSHFYNSCCL